MSAAHEITLMGREFRIRSEDDPAHLQALADYNIARYNLKGIGEDVMDTDGLDTVRRGGPVQVM